MPSHAPEYAVAKAGMMRLAGALGETRGVRVSCICPDWVDTPAVRRSLASMTEEERAEVPELVSADEIARLVVDLIRDDTSGGRVVVRPAGGETFAMPRDP